MNIRGAVGKGYPVMKIRLTLEMIFRLYCIKDLYRRCKGWNSDTFTVPSQLMKYSLLSDHEQIDNPFLLLSTGIYHH